MDQITEIQARFAIEELFAQYAHTIDSYDGPGWVNCFTTDGVFEVAGEGDDSVRFTGHEQLSVFAHAHIRLLPGTRHVMTNHVTEFEGETSARHKCVLSGTLSRSESGYVFASGWYDSSVVLVNGDWKISHRKVRSLSAHCRASLVETDFLNHTLQIHRRAHEWYSADHGELVSRNDEFVEEVSTTSIEPLYAELEHFLQCVRGLETPAVDGLQASRALVLADLIEKAVEKPAKEISLEKPI